MPPPYNMVVELIIHGQNHGGVYENILHFGTNVVAWDAANYNGLLQTLMNEVADHVEDTWPAAMCDDLTINNLSAQVLHPQVTDALDRTTPTNVVGTQAGSLPSHNCQLIQKRTGGGGRSGRGRLRLFPPPKADVVNSELNNAAFTRLQAITSDILLRFGGAAGTSNWRLTVLSRKPSDPGPPPVLPPVNDRIREVLTMVAVRNVKSERSRMKGSGV